MGNFILDNGIVMTKLNSNDNVELCELFGDAYDSRIDDRFIADMLKQSYDRSFMTYGYKHNDILIAAAHLFVRKSMAGAKLKRIGVQSAKKRQGIGLSLLKDVLVIMKNSNIKTMELECRPYLVYFYEKVGFKTTKREDARYDSQGRNAGKVYTMQLKL